MKAMRKRTGKLEDHGNTQPATHTRNDYRLDSIYRCMTVCPYQERTQPAHIRK